MVVEAHIAGQKKLLARQQLMEITDYILAQFGKHQLPASAKVMKLMAQDKKNRDGRILMALIESIGHALWDVPVDEGEVALGLEYYQTR